MPGLGWRLRHLLFMYLLIAIVWAIYVPEVVSCVDLPVRRPFSAWPAHACSAYVQISMMKG